jgi:DNA replication protein DnaC
VSFQDLAKMFAAIKPSLPAPRDFPARWDRAHLDLDDSRQVLKTAPLRTWAECSCRAGWVAGSDQAAIPCRCGEIKDLSRRYNMAEIPSRYALISAASTDWECPAVDGWLHPLPTPDRYSKWLGALRPNGAGVVFCGGTGTGKTHMIALAAHTLLCRGFTARWIDWPAALREAKGRFGQADQGEWPPPSWASVDFLFLDEIGASGSDTRWARDQLQGVLSDRYRAGRSVIATTNVDEAGMVTALGDMTADRLYEMAMIRHIEGPSRRRRAKMECPI